MSRTKDNSLDYFPLDVDFFSDSRIRRLHGRFGSDGPMFLIYIFCRCYGGEGYYIEANDDFYEDAALDIGCTVEKIGLMLNYLLDKSLLDSTLFNTVKVLTSHGIQAQYQKSKKGCKRDIEVDEALWVLDDAKTEGFVKVRPERVIFREISDNSGKLNDNSGNYPQSKVKESKVNQSKNIDDDNTAREAQMDLGAVMRKYMELIQSVPPSFVTDLLKNYTEDLGAEVVCYAIEKTAADNIRTWSYVQTILRNYTQKGVRTLEAAKRDAEEFRKERSVGAKKAKSRPQSGSAPQTVTKSDLDQLKTALELVKRGGQQ